MKLTANRPWRLHEEHETTYHDMTLREDMRPIVFCLEEDTPLTDGQHL
jgi:hypothetical protein